MVVVTVRCFASFPVTGCRQSPKLLCKENSMKKGNVKKTIPIEGNYAKITSDNLEHNILSLFMFERKLEKGIIKRYTIRHKTITTSDGNLQIDGTIRYSDIFFNHLIPFECKCNSEIVKRKQIWELKEKIKNERDRKGVFVTTSYYQFSAIKYAEEHGILLLSILSEETQYNILNKAIKERNYFSNKPVIIIKPFRAARVRLNFNAEAVVSFFEPGDFRYYLWEYNPWKKKKHG